MRALIAAGTQHVPAAWLRRAGMLGFWFFFIKGIAWLVAPVVIYKLL